MKAKILIALAALLMLGSVSLNAQEVGNSSNSESTTQLEGDLNHDNKVDVADVTYLVNLIMKNQSEAKDGTYYWYIGAENPSTISNIQTENTKAGWHEIGETTEGFIHDMNIQSNWITLVENATSTDDMVYFYIVVPDGVSIVNGIGTDLTSNGQLLSVDCSISGYKAYKYYKNSITVKGLILKGNNQGNNDNDDYYWYIGVDNPASISDIQTDNTKPGWHSIGTSLSDFVLDTNTNRITLSTTDRVIYYVVIPNELHIYNGLNINIESIDFVEETCNITGYKAFRFVPEEGVSGVKHVSGPIIKEGIPVSEVSISTSESSINVGNTLQLEATVSPSNATNQNVTWSSSNPEIATVDETTGLVTGVAIGTTTIIATSVSGNKTATTRVEVVDQLSDYYWYAGVTLPSSTISNIQTDPTQQGWHRIGSSLDGFIHDTNDRSNRITLVEHPTSIDDMVYYYIVIPNGLKFKDSLGSNLKTNGDFTKETNFNMSGYEAYKSNNVASKIQGIIFEE